VNRPDTFSLGVCNGCQLMALLGLIPALSGGEKDDDDVGCSICIYFFLNRGE